MKSRNTFLVAALVFCGVFAAHADTLLWLVDPDDSLAQESNFDYAALYYSTQDGQVGRVKATLDNGQSASEWDSTWAWGEEAAAAFVQNAYTDYSFFVSLMSGGQSVAQSETYSYAALERFVSKDPDVPTGGDVWTVRFSTDTIPEPSSAMLLLLGGALLALKRRVS